MQNLVDKLLTVPNKFDISSQQEFYELLNLEERLFHFTKLSENIITDFLKELKTNKVTGMENLTDLFLTDGWKVLATPMAQISNLFINLSTEKPFPKSLKK